MQEVAGETGALAPVRRSDRRNGTKVMGEVQRKRVLVVDDNESVREILSRVLSWYEVEVKEACNGFDALTLLTEYNFRLVLTDLQMPGMDGVALAAKIKKKWPGTRIVLVTGMERKAVERKLKAGYVDSVLYKPFGLNELEEMIVSGVGESRKG
jgi:CheY-like chemotaxis protein